MKQSVYNIIAIVLLIAAVGYLNIFAMEKQKEAINKIDIAMDKIRFFGNNNYTMSDLLDKYNGYKKSIAQNITVPKIDGKYNLSINRFYSTKCEEAMRIYPLKETLYTIGSINVL